MGGLGSGRQWYFDAKETTDSYRVLDMRRWQKDGLLVPPRWFSWQWLREGEVIASIQAQIESGHLRLMYRFSSGDSDWADMQYTVSLDWTPCHFGSERAWFICPVAGCGRRVAILYGGSIFACRRCYRLAYPSQRESADD